MSQRQKQQRGAPSVKKAANGFYYIHWSEGRRSKRQSTGTTDEVEAYQTFAQWILIDGKDRTVGAPEHAFTVHELWDVYYEKHVQKRIVGRETVDYSWKNLKPHFGQLLFDQVNQDRCDEYERLRAAGKIGRKAKPVTIRRELAYLFAALNFCAEPPVRLIPKASIEVVRLPSAGEPRDRWLKIEEMQRLLDGAAVMRRGSRMTRAERFLWIALETAARKQAILDLTWDRVDFETNTIEFNVPGRVRTSKRRVAVSISSALRPVLQRAYEERVSDLVLDNKAAVWKSIQLAAIKAGFSEQTVARGQKPKATGISPHVLRHTAATHMARRGVPLWKIAQVLGNTLAMVEKVYAKWCPDDPAGTVDMISGGALEPAE
ncbi:hypothetical protein XM25_00840 [Devosia sp. H5989]|nr:hypothetical protein XM25_00840 [Devosia sp. H5989]